MKTQGHNNVSRAAAGAASCLALTPRPQMSLASIETETSMDIETLCRAFEVLHHTPSNLARRATSALLRHRRDAARIHRRRASTPQHQHSHAFPSAPVAQSDVRQSEWVVGLFADKLRLADPFPSLPAGAAPIPSHPSQLLLLRLRLLALALAR